MYQMGAAAMETLNQFRSLKNAGFKLGEVSG